MNDDSDDGHSLQAMLCYPGGKSRMLPTLLPLIPEHCCYVEPFVGAGWLFFKKPLADKNVIGDIDPELINFYQTFRDIPKDMLLENLDNLWVVDEKLFNDYRDKVNMCRDQGQCSNNPNRAILFLYVIQNSYGCRGGNFGFKKLCKQCDYPRLSNILPKFEEYQQKLRNTIIELGDYKKTMIKYDAPCTFFYLDPPYYQPSGKVYKFHDVDPRAFAEFLKTIKGKFLLSYDNVPELFDIFSDFKIAVVDHNYTLARMKYAGGRQSVKELLISNYDPPRR